MMTLRILFILLACLPAASLGLGCAPGSPSPYATDDPPFVRKPAEAERLGREGAALMGVDDVEAERLLRAALAADLYYGPAHNNLGVLHLRRGDLYAAANEFEWARKLMPGHPDPRLNLGLTLERAGRIDDAHEAFTSALEVYPGHMPTIEALAVSQLRYGRANEETDAYLAEIALRGTSAFWREWAMEQRIQRRR